MPLPVLPPVLLLTLVCRFIEFIEVRDMVVWVSVRWQSTAEMADLPVPEPPTTAAMVGVVRPARVFVCVRASVRREC